MLCVIDMDNVCAVQHNQSSPIELPLKCRRCALQCGHGLVRRQYGYSFPRAFVLDEEEFLVPLAGRNRLISDEFSWFCSRSRCDLSLLPKSRLFLEVHTYDSNCSHSLSVASLLYRKVRASSESHKRIE